MSHFDQEALFRYVEGTSLRASEIVTHLESCAHCAAEVGETRALVAHLNDPAVWQPEPLQRRFSVDVAAFAERMRDEEARAAVLCDEVLSGPPAWWSQRLRQAEGSRTAGIVTELLGRYRSTLERAPAQALQITALALEVAGALEISQYPCDYAIKLRAQASRDHAFVLAFLGRQSEALVFVDRAKQLFEQVPLPEYDLARVAMVKATILRDRDDGSAALTLARDAASTFLRFGDRTRFLQARITEGAILYEHRALAEALQVWTSIEADPALDDVSSVRLLHNLALCCSELNEPLRASEYLTRCIPQFVLLGMDTEVTRSRWLLGGALVSGGRPEQAVPVLRAAWREFEHFEMLDDAALAALELAEALLLCGQSQEVPAICRALVDRFTRAGMAPRALTALSFLREAVAIGQGSPVLIRHVHAFLRELPSQRPLLHAPAPPGMGE